MATAAEFLAVAKAQLGTPETPPGSNRTKYGRWFGVDGVAWCAIFVSWCMNQVGESLRSAWCDDWMNWAKQGRNGLRWVGQYDQIRPGDLAIFDWDGGYSDHIAAVAVAHSDGSWTSIEGNWADRVSQVTRGRANIRGFVRPNWSGAPSASPPAGDVSMSTPAVKIYQAMLNKVVGTRLAVDGDYGPATKAAVAQFQRFANDMYLLAGNSTRLAVDGQIGKSTLPVLHWWFVAVGNPAPPAMPVPSGTPVLRQGSPDGDPVRQLQAALNRAQNGDLRVDGVYGPGTERAVKFFQTSKRLAADGIYGPATAAKLRAAVA